MGARLYADIPIVATSGITRKKIIAILE